MLFWLTFCTTLLLCGTMVGFGHLFRRRAPKSINPVFGYRTTLSRKNRETWAFAHKTAGRIWWRSGWLTLAASLLVLALFRRSPWMEQLAVALPLLQLGVLLLVIPITEGALGAAFEKDGSPKQPPASMGEGEG